MSPTVLPRLKPKHALLGLAAVILGLLGGQWLWSTSYGDSLGNRSLELSENLVSEADTTYKLSFDLPTSGMLGSIRVQFCSNDPLVNTPCTAPTDFSDSAAIIASQTGPGDFAIDGSSTANELVLTRSPSVVPVGPVSFTFEHIANPSVAGAYYVRLLTYASNDTSGPFSDYGGIAFLISDQVSVTAEVPPYLIFCTGLTITNFNCADASGDFIDFGELSPSHSSSGSSQILVATNSASGYSVTAGGTSMTSGNNVIQAIAGGDFSRPGTPQFGFNLTANSTPAVGATPSGPGFGQPQPSYNQPNTFRFNDGDVILAQPQPDITRLYTASYLVNVPAGQAPGIYVTTLTYVCLANF